MKVELMELSSFSDPSIMIAALLGFISSALVVYFYWNRKSSSSPFTENYIRDPEPIETNQKRRDQVIKNGFKLDRVPKNLDAIVVGSGLGGLSCAASLARAGKKVLVLEQHDRAGGCTHTYEEKGFEFDIGLHYIGQVHPGTLGHSMFDILSDGQLVWETLDKDFDSVVIKQPDGTFKYYNLCSGKGDYEQRLIEHFPGEEKAIREFMDLTKKCAKSILGFMMLKVFPKWILKLLITLKLYKFWSFGFDEYSRVTVKEVVDRLTDNNELKTVFTYCFGDYATVPSRTPFFMHAMLMYHFYHASYYPRGGASELAYTMIPAILRSGGAVLVRAPVSRVIFKDDRAIGVCVKKNDQEHEIFAPIVVSNAGAYNTYNRLIPRDMCQKLGLKSIQNKVGHGFSCLQVLVGLKGTAEELGLKKRNYWTFTTTTPEKSVMEYLSLSKEDAANVDVPILFVSFPSTKDSTWQDRHPDKSVCVIVTFASWEWFKQWKEDRVMKRGIVYQNLKQAFQDRIWSQVTQLFPQLEGKVEYIDTGTPITHRHYISSPKGEIYGVDHSMERFSYDVAMDMRPKTVIPGLYLTGQDVITCGIVASAIGGVMTASDILGRNLMKDLFMISSKRRKMYKKKKAE
ncbi:all-trans-retinol 13,14-reductase-like isoform X1 [Styela clava]